MAAYDLTNKRFDKLVAQKIVKKDTSGHNYWQCLCDCGTVVIVRATELTNGTITMCKDCKKNHKKKIDHVVTQQPVVDNIVDDEINYDTPFHNIVEISDVSILNVPIIFNVVHAINADLTYSVVTKDPATKIYRDSLAGEYDKFFKIGEQINELSVCEWNVGDVIYTAPVYSLLTKNDRYDNPSYESVEKCLYNLKNMALDNGTFYLAFPKICCGKDGLEWNKVKLLIKKVFGDSEFEIMLFE